ncbi:hypothetical protein ACFQY4_20110 [Catellatospora bangladeshensis]|uniref:hypothetical protein n=1 Tax=Catellatospora bangladeshensis TaxID=310355 RepID=UPI00360C5B54
MLKLIGNEWLKLRTTRGFVILLVIQLVLITAGAAGPLSNMPSTRPRPRSAPSRTSA